MINNLIIIVAYLSFLLFSLGQLQRISFFNQLINIYIYEIALAISLLLLFLKCKFIPITKSLSKFKIIYLFLAFLLITFFFELNKYSPWQNLTAYLYLLRLIFYYVYFFYFYYFLKENKTVKKHLKVCLISLILIVTVTSLIQYFLYPDLRNLIYQGWDPHLYRSFGVFFDTSIAGAIYGLLFLWLFFKQKNNYYFKVIRLILLSMLFFLIISIFSRSLYIAIFFVLFIYLLTKKRFAALSIIIFFSILLFVVIPKPQGEGAKIGRIFSIESRLKDYGIAYKLWIKKPLIGYGYNRIRYIKNQNNIVDYGLNHAGASFHSSFLVVLVTGGIVGLILFAGMLLKISKQGYVIRHQMLLLVILSLSDNVILHPFVLFLTLVFLLVGES